MVKAVVAVVMIFIVLLLYAAIVAGSRAEDIEQAYWQDRARQEGREKHGKEEKAPQ